MWWSLDRYNLLYIQLIKANFVDVLLGIISACELLEQLARHRVLPELFLKELPKTNAPYVSVLSFVLFCGALYASASARLNVVSQMRVFMVSPWVLLTLRTVTRFSLVWLTVMSLFPLSLLLLKFNRGRLKRDTRTSLSVVITTLVISAVAFAGNIAVNPITAGSVFFCSL
jgi:amino acid transporter